MEKRPLSAKGLSALIPDAPARSTRRARRSRSTSTCSRPTATSRARRSTTRASTSSPQSIPANGIIQPIIVVPPATVERQRYQIIAGERRWRAAQRAGLLRVPVVVKDVRRTATIAAARDGAHREHPAREPEPDRRGARVPAPRRRVPACTQEEIAARRRQGPRDGRQRPAAAEAAGGSARQTSPRASSSMGHARALLGLPAETATSGAWRARSSRAACRCARPRRS